MNPPRIVRRIPTLLDLCVKGICNGVFKDDEEGRNWRIGIGVEKRENVMQVSDNSPTFNKGD